LAAASFAPVQSELLRHLFQRQLKLLVLAIHFVAKRLLLATPLHRSLDWLVLAMYRLSLLDCKIERP
jgi:hypothetical protein